MAKENLTVTSAPIADLKTGVITPPFRAVIEDLLESQVANIAGWSDPTGTGSRATFDANWTTTVSNPPTQAEVTAVRDQLIAVQKRVAQLILDLQEANVLS